MNGCRGIHRIFAELYNRNQVNINPEFKQEEFEQQYNDIGNNIPLLNIPLEFLKK